MYTHLSKIKQREALAVETQSILKQTMKQTYTNQKNTSWYQKERRKS